MTIDEATQLLKERAEREGEIMQMLDPSLPIVTRIVMAGDLRQADDALSLLRKNIIDIHKAMTMTGSYGRMAMLLKAVDDGLVQEYVAAGLLPEWWPSSDPDDTDERLLNLWYVAFARRGGLVTDEGYTLPRGYRFTVWRGQREGDPIGFAWSLNRSVAEKFANGASFRAAIQNPVIMTMEVPRGAILAYLTRRGEEEVIIDPLHTK